MINALFMKWIRSGHITIFYHFWDKIVFADLLTYWNAGIILTASDPYCKLMINLVKKWPFLWYNLMKSTYNLKMNTNYISIRFIILKIKMSCSCESVSEYLLTFLQERIRQLYASQWTKYICHENSINVTIQ